MLDVNPHLDLYNYQFRVHVDAIRVRPGNVPAHSVAGLCYGLESRHRLVDLIEGEGSMGGGGGHGESTTYKGFTIHHPKRWHVVTGKGLCAIMWVGVILGKDMVTTLMTMGMNMRRLTSVLIEATEGVQLVSLECLPNKVDSDILNEFDDLFKESSLLVAKGSNGHSPK
ncbi:hypothetical protein C4D60_Mb02t05560 [Musa balbisiana]|uniref:Uncharacterized protein n=1 Tax=Musa balbisiana TaxID=52838 RepID=A0A4S8I8H1_MUSBA|nr:hypothetical protein C4D60_Mb02t05560 [Musa balbisiana]